MLYSSKAKKSWLAGSQEGHLDAVDAKKALDHDAPVMQSDVMQSDVYSAL